MERGLDPEGLITAPGVFAVNGRTILETEEGFRWAVVPLYMWNITFLVVVILNEAQRGWFADMSRRTWAGC